MPPAKRRNEAMSTRPLRAVVAARLSRVRAGSTGDVTQGTDGQAYAEQHGWRIVGQPRDLDVSAIKTSPWDRPELGYWLDNPDKFDVLIFRDISRIARRKHDFPEMMKWADENDIRLVCLQLGGETIDFGTSVGRIVGNVLAEVAVMEGDAITERVLRARKYLRENARWPGGKVPYGYRTCPHESGKGFGLEPNPDEMPFAIEMVDRIIAGDSQVAIAKDFNKRGIKPPGRAVKRKDGEPTSPPRWHQATVRDILRSDALRNIVIHDDKPVRGEDGLPLRYGPALITDERFFELQVALANASRPGDRKRGASGPLLGVAFCGHCDHRLYPHETKTYSKTYRYLKCHSNRDFNTGCVGATADANEAEQFISDQLLSAVGWLPIIKDVAAPVEDNSAAIQELEIALNELEADRYERGLYSTEDGKKRFAARYAGIEKQLETLRALPTPETAPRRVFDPEDTFAARWEAGDWQGRTALMREYEMRLVIEGRVRDDKRPMAERAQFDLGKAGAMIGELKALMITR